MAEISEARVMGVHHVNLRASAADVAVLMRFYCDVVGLRLGPRPQLRVRGFWLYAGDLPMLHLSEVTEEAALTPIARRQSALDHVAFRCTGLNATLARLEQQGISYAISVLPEIGETQVVFRDPLQLGVELTFRTEEGGDKP